jgi:hypothetical protein
MGVQQSGDPISLSGGESMLSGGQVNDNAGQQMSAPGSPGAAPLPNPAQVGEQHQPPSFGSGADVSEELANPSGSKAPGVVRGPDGRWAQSVNGTPNPGMWQPTPSSRG